MSSNDSAHHAQRRYPPELKDRAVRMVGELRREDPADQGVIGRVARQLGVGTESLRAWVKQTEVDAGARPGVTSAEHAELIDLRREVKELRRANEILLAASSFFGAGARPATAQIVAFIETNRARFGVEPICDALQFAPSTYYAAITRPPSARSIADEALCADIVRLHAEHFGVYGVEKMWWALGQADIDAGRDRVARLMRSLGLRGVRRGGYKIVTTRPDAGALRPPDLVKRNFVAAAPNRLWVVDLTYVWTWSGFVYTAFVTDVFARLIVGWRVGASLCTETPLDALEMAIWARRGQSLDQLVHHSDAGVQYLSLRYTERLVDAGVAPSVGTVGDSYDNALAESVNGAYKAECIGPRGPWRDAGEVEIGTAAWVGFHNKKRLHGSLNRMCPVAFEAAYWAREQASSESGDS
ncbi:MAG: IS3 family transposase [Acidimicrobiales bacterium]